MSWSYASGSVCDRMNRCDHKHHLWSQASPVISCISMMSNTISLDPTHFSVPTQPSHPDKICDPKSPELCPDPTRSYNTGETGGRVDPIGIPTSRPTRIKTWGGRVLCRRVWTYFRLYRIICIGFYIFYEIICIGFDPYLLHRNIVFVVSNWIKIMKYWYILNVVLYFISFRTTFEIHFPNLFVRSGPLILTIIRLLI